MSHQEPRDDALFSSAFYLTAPSGAKYGLSPLVCILVNSQSHLAGSRSLSPLSGVYESTGVVAFTRQVANQIVKIAA